MSYLNNDAIPVGFGMGLAQNISAMKHFSGMTEAEKEEMEELISSLNPLPGGDGDSFF